MRQHTGVPVAKLQNYIHCMYHTWTTRYVRTWYIVRKMYSAVYVCEPLNLEGSASMETHGELLNLCIIASFASRLSEVG